MYFHFSDFFGHQGAIDELGPEFHGSIHGQQHDDNTKTWINHNLHHVEGSSQREKDVEEHLVHPESECW